MCLGVGNGDRGRTVGSKLHFLSSRWCTFRELQLTSAGALLSGDLETREDPGRRDKE